jgi:hypothetical protein
MGLPGYHCLLHPYCYSLGLGGEHNQKLDFLALLLQPGDRVTLPPYTHSPQTHNLEVPLECRKPFPVGGRRTFPKGPYQEYESILQQPSTCSAPAEQP